MEMRKGHSVVAVMQTKIIQCFAHPLACHLALLTKPLLNNATYSGQAALPERWNKTIHSRRNFEVVSSGIPAGSCRLCLDILDDFDHMPDLSHLPKRASLFWPMNINKLCWSLLDCRGKTIWMIGSRHTCRACFAREAAEFLAARYKENRWRHVETVCMRFCSELWWILGLQICHHYQQISSL